MWPDGLDAALWNLTTVVTLAWLASFLWRKDGDGLPPWTSVQEQQWLPVIVCIVLGFAVFLVQYYGQVDIAINCS